jgi:hypothetical protein
MRDLAISSDLLDIFLKGINEILPADELKILGCHDAELSDKSTALLVKVVLESEKQYGLLSACGLFFRCGSAAFKFLVRLYGKESQIDSLEFRLQPQQKRLLDGTQKMIGLLVNWQAGEFSMLTMDDLVEITASTKGNRIAEPGGYIWLHFIAGLFQEYLYWAGGGKQYPFQILAKNQPASEMVIQFRTVPVD